jgi:hypothetical protein
MLRKPFCRLAPSLIDPRPDTIIRIDLGFLGDGSDLDDCDDFSTAHPDVQTH